ncbi:MAG: DUF2796 domain-containing protein, partial [Gammaproteobacteria bacterium]|nr:DUF2796 domain-containing protein [Gammaproteobacteria bacterium]
VLRPAIARLAHASVVVPVDRDGHGHGKAQYQRRDAPARRPPQRHLLHFRQLQPLHNEGHDRLPRVDEQEGRDHEHDEHDKENHETNEASDHAEFIANYEYQCLSSDELKTIQLTLFDDYQELHKIRVYLITENKQTTFLLHDDKVIIHLN